MSDFFKKAAGLIFNVEDDEAGEAPEHQAEGKKEEQTAAATPPVNVPASPVAGSSIDNKVTEKFRAYFKDLYDRSNLQGPDFYEFNNMTEAMGSVIADDIKYPSVYAGFGGALSKDKLLTSAQQYLNIVQNDVVEFEHSFQTAIKTKVDGRRAQIESKADDIKKMQEQIAKLNNEIIELNRLAQEDEMRLQSEKLAYQQQSEMLQARIKSGMEKVNRYIK